MRRNELYNIETKLRSCVPPPAFKQPRAPQWWDRCTEDGTDNEEDSEEAWKNEKVRAEPLRIAMAEHRFVRHVT